MYCLVSAVLTFLSPKGLGWRRVAFGRVRSLPNRGEGSCLFQALSHQLGGAYLAPQLRQLAVDYMAAHVEEYNAQLTDLGAEMLANGELPIAAAATVGHGGNPDLLVQLVLNTLRFPWTWGGAECIAALANVLRRNIIVYLEDGPNIMFEPVLVDAPALRILHRFGAEGRRTHYESVLQWQPAPPPPLPVVSVVP